jgi:hypothetical protein
MPTLVSIPTQTFSTRQQMLDDQAATPWSQNRYVLIMEDELYAGSFSYHIFKSGELMTMFPVEVEAIGIPSGGTDGQMLVKASPDNYDTLWVDPPIGIPDDGTTGQMLAKMSNLDYDADWVDAPTGGVTETFALLIAPGGKRLKIAEGINLKIT